jgi:hypothetical protein
VYVLRVDTRINVIQIHSHSPAVHYFTQTAPARLACLRRFFYRKQI